MPTTSGAGRDCHATCISFLGFCFGGVANLNLAILPLYGTASHRTAVMRCCPKVVALHRADRTVVSKEDGRNQAANGQSSETKII